MLGKSIQLENGYLKIANDLVDKLCKVKMSGQSWQVLLSIIRKLYGYGKKEDWVEYSQLMLLTKLKKERISESVRLLREYGIVTQFRNGQKQILGIEKNFKLKEKRYTQSLGISLGTAKKTVTDSRVNRYGKPERTVTDSRVNRYGIPNNKRQLQKTKDIITKNSERERGINTLTGEAITTAKRKLIKKMAL